MQEKWETVRSARRLNKLFFPYCSILTEELYLTDLFTALCTSGQYDKIEGCAYFAAQGYCKETSQYRDYVQSNCPASCGNCESKSEGTINLSNTCTLSPLINKYECFQVYSSKVNCFKPIALSNADRFS